MQRLELRGEKLENSGKQALNRKHSLLSKPYEHFFNIGLILINNDLTDGLGRVEVVGGAGACEADAGAAAGALNECCRFSTKGAWMVGLERAKG